MKISRKDFLKLSSLLAISPLVLLNGFNCSQKDYTTSLPENHNLDQFSLLMLNQPKLEISSHSIKKGECYLIPLSSIVIGQDNIGYVDRIRFQNNKIMFQGVAVRVVEKVGSSAWVTNLEEGDVLLADNKKTMNELKRINIKELRTRFILPVKSLPD